MFDLRAKLDAAGYYDSFEVDRVVKAELDPSSTQGDLVSAIMPVADRLLKAYKEAQDKRRVALSKEDDKGAKDAKDEMDALLLFRGDMGAFIRVYAFLSQIFDYGNTDIEKRSIFFKRLIPLLDFGRERDVVDVSQIKLTHHKLSTKGKKDLVLSGFSEPLTPYTAPGSGSVQDKDKALLAEIVARVNDLFQGELTDDDQLIYVNNVLKGKLMESETLARQAEHNTKEQFANSPDLSKAIMDAIMDAFDAHSTMSKQALDSQRVRDGIKDILLGPGRLWEGLREKAEA